MTSARREPKTSEAVDLQARAEDVRSAIGSARLEGLTVTPASREVLEDYASVSIDADELVDRVLRLYGFGARGPHSTTGQV